jgi:glucosylceramidase
MIHLSRRVFIKRAITAASTIVCTNGLAARGQKVPTIAAARGWITTGHEKYKEFSLKESSEAATAPIAVEIDPGERFQSILGFGGAFTDASCYLLGGMPAEARKALLDEFFGPDGLQLSVGRTCIGSSDYSRTAYTYDDSKTPDPELQGFSIEHDRGYILPVLRDALAIRPELFLFSTPWSPPAWMKTGDSLCGGSMRKSCFKSYAQYFINFLEAYKAEGVPIGAVTIQNEVDTDQDGKMPATLWGQEYEAGFITEFLGPALRSANLDTKIWLLDHNYNLWGRVMDLLGDPALNQYVDGVAWHGYAGTPDAMTTVHNAFPSKGAYWTEGGPFYTAPDYTADWAKWSGTFTQVLKNWARCALAWNLVLDENGKPNIGPFDCGGLVTLDSKTRKITRSGQYWALAHYAKAVRRGARVIASRSAPSAIDHVAFANLDGSFVLVLTNPGEACTVNCRFGGDSLPVTLAGNSVVTLQWA